MIYGHLIAMCNPSVSISAFAAAGDSIFAGNISLFSIVLTAMNYSITY